MHESRRRMVRLLPLLVVVVAGMVAASPAAGAAHKERLQPLTVDDGVRLHARGLTAVSPDFAAAAVPANDQPGAALFLGRDVRIGALTQDATETGDPGILCDDPPAFGGTGSWAFRKTVWYRVKGNGGRIVLDTWGSSIDTMIAVYVGTNPSQATYLGCDDDRVHQPGDPVGVYQDAGIVIVDSQVGTDYLVQIGSPCCNPPGGSVLLSYIASDDRARPGTLVQGASDATTVGASDESEVLSCGTVGYHNTTWYRINVTEPGTLRFNATGVGWQPVATLFPAGSNAPLPGCGLGNNGARTASIAPYLRRGAYDLQVGGIDDWGYYTYTYTFDVDPDEDRDTYKRAPYNGAALADCDDSVSGGAIHPGAWDKKDGINNDCDAYIDEDADRDGEDARFAGGPDCYPDDPRFPTTREVRGNGIDENCDGRKEYPSFVTVQVQPGFTRTPPAFDYLRIRPVPKGATLRIRCKGGGCPHGSLKKHFRRRKAAYDAIGYAKDIAIHSNTVVEVRVTRRFAIGKYVKIFIRSSGSPDKIERCLPPGKSKPRKCA